MDVSRVNLIETQNRRTRLPTGDLFTISLPQALALLDAGVAAGRDLGDKDPVTAESVTLDRASELLAARQAAGPGKK